MAIALLTYSPSSTLCDPIEVIDFIDLERLQKRKWVSCHCFAS
jgi:hypothetical protein